MSIPELITGFFMSIFYAFYYSGYAVVAVIRYFLIDVLMSLMRGPTEEVVDEPPVEEDRFGMKALQPALPVEEPPGTMQAFGLDINKEENGQLKMAPHESSQSGPTSSDETGEGAPEDGTGDPNAEVEQPMTLVSSYG